MSTKPFGVAIWIWGIGFLIGAAGLVVLSTGQARFRIGDHLETPALDSAREKFVIRYHMSDARERSTDRETDRITSEAESARLMARANYALEQAAWNAKVEPLLADSKSVMKRFQMAHSLWLESLTDSSRSHWDWEQNDAKAQLEAIMAKIKAIPKPPPLELVP